VDFKKQFDHLLPIINRDTSELYFEVTESFKEKMTVKNDGGGIITGRIMSNSSAITFDSEEFQGNDSEILFSVDTSMYTIGDTLKTSAVIMSNGGEHTVEFVIKIVPHAIETKEGTKIVSLEDFCRYAKERPVQASQLLHSSEFGKWLYSSGYEYMDFYEELLMDSDRSRAVWNFLAFNGYKPESVVAFKNSHMTVKIAPHMNLYPGSIGVVKRGTGSVDEQIALKNKCTWIKINQNRLLDGHFDENGEAYISFTIESDKLIGKRSTAILCIGEDEMELVAKTLEVIEASLEKEYLTPKESSLIHIKNNSASTVTVNILPKDNFIKIENNKLNVKESAKIPFHIELSKVQSAQFALVRQPEVKTEITVNAMLEGNKFTKKLNLTIGWF